MQHHFHFSIENVLFAGVSAIIVINLTRIVAAQLSKIPGLKPIGDGVGAIVS